MLCAGTGDAGGIIEVEVEIEDVVGGEVGSGEV
jgi:hypothetical protein